MTAFRGPVRRPNTPLPPSPFSSRRLDAFSLSDVRGLAAFDVRHRVVTSFGYEVPLRQRWFGGWTLLGIVSAQSGGPLAVTEPVDVSPAA
ncbi:MAG: hypothetical protein JNN08_21575 [Bryobacterales bacterium]|nr:hypothetical protein [Bryobacterales bacterium]